MLETYCKNGKKYYFCTPFAGVVELVDTLDLGSSAARCESSSLSACTNKDSDEKYYSNTIVWDTPP